MPGAGTVPATRAPAGDTGISSRPKSTARIFRHLDEATVEDELVHTVPQRAPDLGWADARTKAAIQGHGVLVESLLAPRAGRAPTARHDGDASCPRVTGRGKLLLAELDYDRTPMEIFPFDQSEERWSMWAMKTYALPELYWNGMSRGRA